MKRDVFFALFIIIPFTVYSQAYKKSLPKNPFTADSLEIKGGINSGGKISFKDSLNAVSNPAIIWLRNSAANSSVSRLILSEDAGAGALIEYDGAANEFRIKTGTAGPTGFIERVMVHRDLDVLAVGRAGFSTTSGVVQIAIASGAVPASAVANTVLLYAADSVGIAQLYVLDEGGQTTKLSPHNPLTGRWEYWSKNLNTGKVVKIRLEEFFKWFDKRFGTNFVQEWYEFDNLRVLPMTKKLKVRDGFIQKQQYVKLDDK